MKQKSVVRFPSKAQRWLWIQFGEAYHACSRRALSYSEGWNEKPKYYSTRFELDSERSPYVTVTALCLVAVVRECNWCKYFLPFILAVLLPSQSLHQGYEKFRIIIMINL